MISYIEGKVIRQDEKSLVVLSGGIGYKVFTTNDTIMSNPEGKSVSFWTHFVVREDTQDLYGFSTQADLDTFSILLNVSGIGPRTALNILSLASRELIEQAIITGESGPLVKIAGVSKKNAEKIVIELKGKVIGDAKNRGGNFDSADGDVIEALKSLGYSPNQARDALKEIPKTIKGANARIKEALKFLGK